MRILGIDYGTKRIGLAVGDTATGLAFPQAVLKNDKEFVSSVIALCKKEDIEKIVIGESKDLNGTENEILEDARRMKEVLEKEIGLPVIFEPEFYSTYQASRIQGDSEMIDASAATIILQSFMDKMKNYQ